MRTVPLLLLAALLLAVPAATAQLPGLSDAPDADLTFECLVGTPEFGVACFDPGTHEFCLVMFHNGWIDTDICPGG